MITHVPYNNHAQLIGVIHKAGYIDVRFDIVFISYATVSNECVDCTTHVISIMTLNID